MDETFLDGETRREDVSRAKNSNGRGKGRKNREERRGEERRGEQVSREGEKEGNGSGETMEKVGG